MSGEKDYKAIAEALADRLFFALDHWKYSGGLAMNRETGKAQTPMRYFAKNKPAWIEKELDKVREALTMEPPDRTGGSWPDGRRGANPADGRPEGSHHWKAAGKSGVITRKDRAHGTMAADRDSAAR